MGAGGSQPAALEQIGSPPSGPQAQGQPASLVDRSMQEIAELKKKLSRVRTENRELRGQLREVSEQRGIENEATPTPVTKESCRNLAEAAFHLRDSKFRKGALILVDIHDITNPSSESSLTRRSKYISVNWDGGSICQTKLNATKENIVRILTDNVENLTKSDPLQKEASENDLREVDVEKHPATNYHDGTMIISGGQIVLVGAPLQYPSGDPITGCGIEGEGTRHLIGRQAAKVFPHAKVLIVSSERKRVLALDQHSFDRTKPMRSVAQLSDWLIERRMSRCERNAEKKEIAQFVDDLF